MNTTYYRKAAENIAGEPVSIETDGTVWVDSDHRNIETQIVEAEAKRLETEEKAARTAAIAHAKSLGFTDAMIAIMYPNLGGNNE